MRILHIKMEHNGVSEYKITSKKGCCYKNLMGVTERLMLKEYVEMAENNKIQDLEAKLGKAVECIEQIYEETEPDEGDEVDFLYSNIFEYCRQTLAELEKGEGE